MTQAIAAHLCFDMGCNSFVGSRWVTRFGAYERTKDETCLVDPLSFVSPLSSAIGHEQALLPLALAVVSSLAFTLAVSTVVWDPVVRSQFPLLNLAISDCSTSYGPKIGSA